MRSRKLILAALGVAVLAAAAAATTAVLWSRLAPPRLPTSLRAERSAAHIRIVWQREPDHHAVVLWDTASASSAARLAWDTAPHDSVDDYAHVADDVETTRYPDPEDSGLVAYRHRVDLRTLPAGSRIHLRVSQDGTASRDYWFRTAPDRDWPVTLVAGGDCLDARRRRTAMNRRIAALAAADPDLLAFAHQGDFVRHGERLEQWLEWLEDHEAATGEDGRLLPLIPARGNHEATGPLFDFVFGREGRPAWYVTELSPELTWISLDTNRPTGGPQLEFLQQALRDHAAPRLRVAHYHAQMYPAVVRASHYERFWGPAFEAGGLDFAIESNGHAIKRTAPIVGGEVDPGGVIYLGEGGLGAKQRKPSRDRWYLQEPGFASYGDHVWKLRADDQGLHGTVILEDGSIAHHEIMRTRRSRQAGGTR